jgi:hypothetical protein
MADHVLTEPHFLPSLEYFCATLPFNNIILEGQEHFVKQSFRNRCYINTAQGKMMLTVPLKERHGKILTKEVQVEPGNKWRSSHWRTIESAYRKAPYFDFYCDELKEILFRGHDLLFDLDRDLLSFCLKSIRSQKNISATLTYEIDSAENIFDLRSVISSKKPFAERKFYQAQSYYQVFGSEFVSNLSIVDLLFCEGPRASEIIRASSQIPNK